jgi:predicted lipoprotein with Yx(FWY)xxD motif
MTRTRLMTVLAAAAAVVLVAVSAATASTQATSSRLPTVKVAKTGLGKILVDSSGRSLYLFKKDTGMKSKCFGECAVAWPPLRVSGKPTAGAGARASLLGTTKRSDGRAQVTYNGHPLYLFEGDKKPGNTNGQGLNAFGARWYLVSPAGRQISGTGSTVGGGGGYGRPARLSRSTAGSDAAVPVAQHPSCHRTPARRARRPTAGHVDSGRERRDDGR